MTVKGKLYTMVGVMLVPFLGVLFYSQAAYTEVSITPWRNEIKGAEVLKPLFSYHVVVVQKRCAPASEAAKFDRDLSNLEGKVSTPLATYDSVLRSRAAWEKVIASTKSTDVDGLAQSQVYLKNFTDDIGKYSSLILDPDLDSSPTMRALVSHLPAYADHMGEVIRISTRADQEALSAIQRHELIFAIATLNSDLNALKFSFDTALEKNPSLKFAGLSEVISAGSAIVKDGTAVATNTIAPDGNSAMAVAAKGQAALNALPTLYASAADELVQLIEGRLTGDATSAGTENVRRNVFLFGLFGAFGVLLAAIGMSADITRSLARAVTALGALRKGDLRGGDLAGDKRSDDFGVLFEGIEDVRTSLRKQIESIVAASRETDKAIAQMLSVTAQVSAAATQTATSLAEASTTADEVKQTAVAAEQKSKNVAQSAGEAAQVAMQGRQGAEKTQEDVAEIRNKMEIIAESILQLSAHGRAIGEIIVSVNDLAEQSNVLAVNASIEAAKAGEAGRGFAVVAQEVKSLADESKKSTIKVRSILSDIERSAASAIMVAEQGTKVAAAGLQQANETGESIRSLGGKVVQSAQAAAQIAASSAQQLAGVDQVVNALIGIRDGSVQVVGALETLDKAAKKLKAESESLLANTSGFQL